MRETDEYDVYYKLNRHTIVFCSDNLEVITGFLSDYYTKTPDCKVLIIGERKIGKTLKPLLNLSDLEGRLYFLSYGKGFDLTTIKKSSMEKCQEVYFLNDPNSPSSEQNDKRALFLKTFLVNNGIHARFYLQFSVQNEIHILNLEKDINEAYVKQRKEELKNSREERESEDEMELTEIEAISYRKFLFKLLAKNTFFQGFIPFITCFLSYNDTALLPSLSVFDKL